ncbi:uncharacterized protein O3C94_007441 isoform 2-T2 [Discoglossus pictus]
MNITRGGSVHLQKKPLSHKDSPEIVNDGNWNFAEFINDPLRKDPLVGLEYAVELRLSGSKWRALKCNLCNCHGTTSKMIRHFIDVSHIKAYFAKDHPALLEILKDTRLSKFKYTDLLKEHARRMEFGEEVKSFKHEYITAEEQEDFEAEGIHSLLEDRNKKTAMSNVPKVGQKGFRCNSVVDYIEDPFRTEPLVGLQYVVEVKMLGSSKVVLKCNLCICSGEVVTMIQHLIGMQHIKNYFKKHHNSLLYRLKARSKNDTIDGDLLKMHGKRIEAQEGVKKIQFEYISSNQKQSSDDWKAPVESENSMLDQQKQEIIEPADRRSLALQYSENFKIMSRTEASLVLGLTEHLNNVLNLYHMKTKGIGIPVGSEASKVPSGPKEQTKSVEKRDLAPSEPMDSDDGSSNLGDGSLKSKRDDEAVQSSSQTSSLKRTYSSDGTPVSQPVVKKYLFAEKNPVRETFAKPSNTCTQKTNLNVESKPGVQSPTPSCTTSVQNPYPTTSGIHNPPHSSFSGAQKPPSFSRPGNFNPRHSTSSGAPNPTPSTSSRVPNPTPSTSSRVPNPTPSTSSRVPNPTPSTSSRVPNPTPSTFSRVPNPTPSTSSRVPNPPPSTFSSASNSKQKSPEPQPTSSTSVKSSKSLSPDILQLLKGKDLATVTEILKSLSSVYPALQDVNIEMFATVLFQTGALNP